MLSILQASALHNILQSDLADDIQYLYSTCLQSYSDARDDLGMEMTGESNESRLSNAIRSVACSPMPTELPKSGYGRSIRESDKHIRDFSPLINETSSVLPVSAFQFPSDPISQRRGAPRTCTRRGARARNCSEHHGSSTFRRFLFFNACLASAAIKLDTSRRHFVSSVTIEVLINAFHVFAGASEFNFHVGIHSTRVGKERKRERERMMHHAFYAVCLFTWRFDCIISKYSSQIIVASL